MDQAEIRTHVEQSIYATINHVDLGFSQGCETDLGKFYLLSDALVAAITDTAWFHTHKIVDDQHDKVQAIQAISSMLFMMVGTQNITGKQTTILQQLKQRLFNTENPNDNPFD